MKKFLIIVVIYKKNIADIVPINYFDKLDSLNFSFFLYDNSPESQLICSLRHNYVYLHDSQNGGISKAYNEGAKYAKKNGYDWLILFDQDTEISDNCYFSKIESAITKYHKINLFVPIVNFLGGTMSPRKCRFFRPSNITIGPGIYKLQNVAIINSGLAISTKSFFKCGGYNNNIILDFADYQFIERLQEVEESFCVINSCLFQDFSNNETDKDKLFNRFKLYCKSLKCYETTYRRYIALLYTGFLHSLALTKRTKQISFLKHFLQSIFR